MTITRRSLLQQATSSAAALAFAGVARPLAGSAKRTGTNDVTATTYRLLPLGEIKPAGWLQRQLRIQADGMSGHLDEFWPDVGPNSGWLGGAGESWERGPYFLDGLLPLAYLLDDPALKAKAKKYVDWTLDHQRDDGSIGPSKNDDWWPRMVMLKALMQYDEATGDPRVRPVMTRYFHYQLEQMPKRPLKSWGKYRWQDEAYVAQWLYDRTKDPRLLQLSTLLQAQGYDWKAQFADFKYTTPMPRTILKNGTEQALQEHGVNNSQALKVAAVQYRISGDKAEGAAFARQLGELDKYHGMPNGMFSCDEHFGGLEPQHGTELCSVVETMYSLEIVLAAFGDASVGDRLEKIAFNALPGTFSDDMWTHQYDQQSNQIKAGLLTDLPWTTNGPDSNMYGLEPHFGCCTANYHQGWPKFTSSLWMKAPDDGLVAAVYAPCEVRTKVRGTAVQVSEETDYPFRNTVRVTVRPETPLAFPLSLRIPGWAQNASLRINGKPDDTLLTPGTFARVQRKWTAGDTIEIVFPMQTRVSRWFNRSVALERGPLVFSMDPGENWVKLRDRGMTADWQVFPKAPWNYALDVHEKNVAALEVTETPVGARPFATSGTGVRLHVPAKRLAEWNSQDGVAPPPPASPVASSETSESLTFVPYACAKLRMTAFPSLLS